MAAGNLSKGAAELLRNAVVVNPVSKHSATLLFLHGLGDTGHGWSQILSETLQPSLTYLKIVCPTAPTNPVTLNGGFKMPSWFDIYSLNKAEKQDEEGIKKAAMEVHELLEVEQSIGIPADRIVLGGFSQGGSLAMYSALTYPKKLAGILGLSTYVSIHSVLEQKMTEANKKTSFLQCHGDSDPMVALQWGQLSSEYISKFNSENYQFKTYRGLGHSSSPQEMDDVKQWLERILPLMGGNM